MGRDYASRYHTECGSRVISKGRTWRGKKRYFICPKCGAVPESQIREQ